MKESAQNRLRRYNIKPSVQRMAVLDYLMTHHTHPTADTIFNALYPSIPTLSKATVYNTLNLLTEHGVIQMITIDEKNARFNAGKLHICILNVLLAERYSILIYPLYK